MKPFLYLLILLLIVSCSSTFTPCRGVFIFAERASFNDSMSLKLEQANQTKTLTETENVTLLNFFKSDASITEKLIAVKNEVHSSIKYVYPPKRIKTTTTREYVSSRIVCEIIFMAIVRGESYVIRFPHITNSNKNLDFLNEKNIDSISVLQGTKAATLYGINGNCGVVILHSSYRELKRKLSKL